MVPFDEENLLSIWSVLDTTPVVNDGLSTPNMTSEEGNVLNLDRSSGTDGDGEILHANDATVGDDLDPLATSFIPILPDYE